MKREITVLTLALGLFCPMEPALAVDEIQIRTAAERLGGYDRNLFKNWIDAITIENFTRVTDYVPVPRERVISKSSPKNLRNLSGNSKLKPGAN